MNWPGGIITKMNAAYNVYSAFKSYQGAKNLVEWTKANDGAWDIVSLVISMELEQKHGNHD